MGEKRERDQVLMRRLERVVYRIPEFPRTKPIQYALLGILGLLLAVRLMTAPAVFQDGSIVLNSNDPYLYRYWVEMLHAREILPWEFPTRIATGEPLLVTALWVATFAFGADQWASGFVLAWYPVVTALITGYLVYAVGVRVSDDPRVGLAAVLVLAVTPAHAYRTSLGFADHHPFDYVWLAVTLYALVVILTTKNRDRWTWVTAGALGGGIAGQVLAWEAGPLLIVPVGLAIGASSLYALDRSTVFSSLLPSVAGVGVGAALVWLAHVGLGWQLTAVVASVFLLFLGSVTILALTVAVERSGLQWPALLVVEVLALVVLATLVFELVPDVVFQFERGMEFLRSATGIGEMSPLTEDYGPIFGPLIILGYAPILALVALALAVWVSLTERSPVWMIVGTYVGYFVVLTLIQRRFAGELAPPLAVLAGFGFVAFLAWLGIARVPAQIDFDSSLEGGLDPPLVVPNRSRRAFIGGLSAVLIGTGSLFTALVDRRTTIDPEAFDAARWMRTYARERDWNYPDNYVLSEWGRNRMYNYVVNGQSESYAYAKEYYEAFLFTSDGPGWYDRFEDRVGFVVTRDFETIENVHPFRLYARLHYEFGSGTDEAPGVGHYRAVYSSPDGEYKVFTLVPGATLTGSVEATDVRTHVSIDGAEFDYVRSIETDGDGTVTVTVAQPGTYRIGDRIVQVSEPAVLNGKTITIG